MKSPKEKTRKFKVSLTPKEVKNLLIEVAAIDIAFELVGPEAVGQAKRLVKGLPDHKLRAIMRNSIYSNGYGIRRLPVLEQLRSRKIGTAYYDREVGNWVWSKDYKTWPKKVRRKK